MSDASTRQREADVLRAMAKSTSLPEQRRLAEELGTIRTAARTAAQDDRDLDLANAVVADVLTPVLTHSHHTASTDWLLEPTAEVAPEAMGRAVLAAASQWFTKRSAEVVADAEEFTAQADGAARRVASAHGASFESAHRTFMDHVEFLRERAHPRKESASRNVYRFTMDTAATEGFGAFALEDVLYSAGINVLDHGRDENEGHPYVWVEGACTQEQADAAYQANPGLGMRLVQGADRSASRKQASGGVPQDLIDIINNRQFGGRGSVSTGEFRSRTDIDGGSFDTGTVMITDTNGESCTIRAKGDDQWVVYFYDGGFLGITREGGTYISDGGYRREQEDLSRYARKQAYVEGVDCPMSGEGIYESGMGQPMPGRRVVSCPGCGQEVPTNVEGYMFTHLLPGKKMTDRMARKQADTEMRVDTEVRPPTMSDDTPFDDEFWDEDGPDGVHPEMPGATGPSANDLAAEGSRHASRKTAVNVHFNEVPRPASGESWPNTTLYMDQGSPFILHGPSGGEWLPVSTMEDAIALLTKRVQESVARGHLNGDTHTINVCYDNGGTTATRRKQASDAYEMDCPKCGGDTIGTVNDGVPSVRCKDCGEVTPASHFTSRRSRKQASTLSWTSNGDGGFKADVTLPDEPAVTPGGMGRRRMIFAEVVRLDPDVSAYAMDHGGVKWLARVEGDGIGEYGSMGIKLPGMEEYFDTADEAKMAAQAYVNSIAGEGSQAPLFASRKQAARHSFGAPSKVYTVVGEPGYYCSDHKPEGAKEVKWSEFDGDSTFCDGDGQTSHKSSRQSTAGLIPAQNRTSDFAARVRANLR